MTNELDQGRLIGAVQRTQDVFLETLDNGQQGLAHTQALCCQGELPSPSILLTDHTAHPSFFDQTIDDTADGCAVIANLLGNKGLVGARVREDGVEGGKLNGGEVKPSRLGVLAKGGC